MPQVMSEINLSIIRKYICLRNNGSKHKNGRISKCYLPYMPSYSTHIVNNVQISCTIFENKLCKGWHKTKSCNESTWQIQFKVKLCSQYAEFVQKYVTIPRDVCSKLYRESWHTSIIAFVLLELLTTLKYINNNYVITIDWSHILRNSTITATSVTDRSDTFDWLVIKQTPPINHNISIRNRLINTD